jgi:hypothetical protein
MRVLSAKLSRTHRASSASIAPVMAKTSDVRCSQAPVLSSGAFDVVVNGALVAQPVSRAKATTKLGIAARMTEA